WGLGYFGGLASTLVVQGLGAADASDFARARWAGPVTAVFFLLAAVPTFLWLKQRGTPHALPAGARYLQIGFQRLGRTARELGAFRDLAVFLVAVFFAMAGMSIIISFAFLYGEQVLQWSGSSMVMMFVLTQVTAAAGAVLFGFIQDRIGAKRTFQLTLGMWIVCIVAIWGVQDITTALHRWLGVDWKVEHVFLALGAMAGLGMGSTQSASRAMVGILAPESKAGEFFGFWGLSGKLASIFGLLTFGLLQFRIGLQPSIPLCAVLFLLALVTTVPVREERGRL
ncbi:MAG: MFS transporter, partial [Verrucomicrobiae bacterium]|nr:MFS transporter [Verrucomicrobiae bacterium]